jgi:hypothetical protein
VLSQVIDLISLKPFDMETISKSIKKTRKALIVEECMKTGGIGASLSAVINESLFDELDHQVRSGFIVSVQNGNGGGVRRGECQGWTWRGHRHGMCVSVDGEGGAVFVSSAHSHACSRSRGQRCR